MDDLSSLRIFVQVVEDGSLSATARRAHTAVSSIARQVKALEDSLGARLLNKTTRRQSLTEAGRVFYERAKIILDEFDRAKRDVSSFQDSVKGVLRVYLRTSANFSNAMRKSRWISPWVTSASISSRVAWMAPCSWATSTIPAWWRAA